MESDPTVDSVNVAIPLAISVALCRVQGKPRNVRENQENSCDLYRLSEMSGVSDILRIDTQGVLLTSVTFADNDSFRKDIGHQFTRGVSISAEIAVFCRVAALYDVRTDNNEKNNDNGLSCL